MGLAQRSRGADPRRAAQLEVWRRKAKVGDRIIIESERVGTRDRTGEILEIRNSPLGPDYRVRWDDGHESEIRPKGGSARIVRPKSAASRDLEPVA